MCLKASSEEEKSAKCHGLEVTFFFHFVLRLYGSLIRELDVLKSYRDEKKRQTQLRTILSVLVFFPRLYPISVFKLFCGALQRISFIFSIENLFIEVF